MVKVVDGRWRRLESDGKEIVKAMEETGNERKDKVAFGVLCSFFFLRWFKLGMILNFWI